MRNQRGATLVELLVYITIVGMVMASVAGFLMNLLTSRAKVQASSEVITNAHLIQDRLHDAMRHAELINTGSSTFGADPGVLSLDMVDASVDPTIFSLTADNGQLQVSEAGGGNVSLTTDDVNVTNLVFTNLTSGDDIGIIQVQFTLEVVNDSTSKLFDYSQSFQTTLRIPLDD